MKRMNTLFDEMIIIMPMCVVHLHGHRNKMVPFLKPFIFVDLSNDAKFHGYNYKLTYDT